MTVALPVWRSMLFVPATSERHVESATRRAADAFQIDLEDSIPPERKAEARARVPEVARRLAGRGADVLVRINRPLRLAIADIAVAVGPDVDALNVPKVPDAGFLSNLAEVIEDVEREKGLAVGHTKVIAMIETAQGLGNMAGIAAAPRVAAITIGAEDLALDLGIAPEADGLYVANMNLLAAARAARILPIGYLGSVAQIADGEAFREVARRARSLGFEGGFCVHPNQIDILNQAFTPTGAELEEACAILDAYEAALARGAGATSFRGRMIDQPVADRARTLLAKGETIARKEARKHAAADSA